MTGKNRVPSPPQAIVAHTDRSVRVLMQQVILGMLPGIGLTWVFFGIGVLVFVLLETEKQMRLVFVRPAHSDTT